MPKYDFSLDVARQRDRSDPARTDGAPSHVGRAARGAHRAVSALACALLGCTGVVGAPGSESSSGPPPSPEGNPPGHLAGTDASLDLRPQLRLLNAREYRATARSLLGLDASSSLGHADEAPGYDTGAEGRVDENLLSLLMTQAQALSANYLAGPGLDAFPCIAAPDATCAATMVASLGPRAYRRPLLEAERAGLVELYGEVEAETGDAALAMESVLTRMLSSVHFLHRAELGALDGDGLDAHERASLLAYALTGSMPDASLRAAADEGMLDREEGLRAEIRRLLNSPAGRRRMARFVRAAARYPKLDPPALGADLRDAFDAFVEDVVYEGEGTFEGLLRADHAFITPRSALLYGAEVEGDGLRRVSLAGGERRGLLSLASVMAVHAWREEGARDRPVMRGLMVKNRFFCEEVGFPSGLDIDAAVEQADLDPDTLDSLTTREAAEAVMNQEQVCQDCHAQFMPLGFLFGRFDSLGRLRSEQHGRPIETAVERIVLRGEARAYPDHLAFIDAVAEEPVAARCFARNAAAYLSGVGEVARLEPLAEQALAEAAESAKGATDVRALFEALLVRLALTPRSLEVDR